MIMKTFHRTNTVSQGLWLPEPRAQNSIARSEGPGTRFHNELRPARSRSVPATKHCEPTGSRAFSPLKIHNPGPSALPRAGESCALGGRRGRNCIPRIIFCYPVLLFLFFAAALPVTWARTLSVGGDNWEKTSDDFFRYVKVEDEIRFTSFAANKTSDTGIALFRFVPGPAAEALEFTVYGGDGKIFLIEDNGTLALAGATEIVETGRMLAASEHGLVLETASGPRDTADGNRVRWDLVPHRGKPLIIAVVDDLTGPWGFIGLSEIKIVGPGSAASGDQPGIDADEAVVFDGQKPRILMPGGRDWETMGGAFFDRRLQNNTMPFITTFDPRTKGKPTGATWARVQLQAGSELTFRVRGGNARVLLLRGHPDFRQIPDAEALRNEINGPLSGSTLESTTGGGNPRRFTEISWKLPADLREATILVLDAETGDSGFIDVTVMTLTPRNS